ncbi:MAG: hypothetical protein ACYDBB_22675 [Armatimonadota bacterium]
MRQLLALAGLCLISLAPVLACLQTTVLDPTYQVGATDPLSGVSIDQAQHAMFATTLGQGPISEQNKRSLALARQMAKANAREVFAREITAMKITGYATVGEALGAGLLSEDVLTTVLRAVRPVRESWDTVHRTVLITWVLPLRGRGTPGELAARMLRTEQKSAEGVKEPRQYPKDGLRLLKKVAAVRQRSDGPYTGVIFDCTGLQVTPLLLPKLVDSNGAELWGTTSVSAQVVLENGIGEYVKSLRDDRVAARAGTTPLIIRPLGTSGFSQGDLVLRPEDAKLLMEQNDQTHFLTTLSVVILTD